MAEGDKKTVILAETKAAVAETVTRQLNRFGIEVILAADGHEVLEKVESPHDLIIMNILMPGMGGIECTKTLRSQGYEKPIIAFSARVSVNVLKNYINIGMNGFLTKPCKTADINALVEKYLK